MTDSTNTVLLDAQQERSLRSVGLISYLLHTVVAVGAVLPGVQASVLLLLIAVVIDLLKRALPGCDEADIFWGYHFVTGALMLTLARTGRIDKLSGGLCHSEDFVAVKERMARFMAAGFLSVCKRPD